MAGAARRRGGRPRGGDGPLRRRHDSLPARLADAPAALGLRRRRHPRPPRGGLPLGFLVSHPGANFLGYPAALLVHVLSADLVFILVPVTRLAHLSLLPAAHALGDIGWKLAPGGGEAVARELGKEGQPI